MPKSLVIGHIELIYTQLSTDPRFRFWGQAWLEANHQKGKVLGLVSKNSWTLRPQTVLNQSLTSNSDTPCKVCSGVKINNNQPSRNLRKIIDSTADSGHIKAYGKLSLPSGRAHVVRFI